MIHKIGLHNIYTFRRWVSRDTRKSLSCQASADGFHNIFIFLFGAGRSRCTARGVRAREVLTRVIHEVIFGVKRQQMKNTISTHSALEDQVVRCKFVSYVCYISCKFVSRHGICSIMFEFVQLNIYKHIRTYSV